VLGGLLSSVSYLHLKVRPVFPPFHRFPFPLEHVLVSNSLFPLTPYDAPTPADLKLEAFLPKFYHYVFSSPPSMTNRRARSRLDSGPKSFSAFRICFHPFGP